MRTISHSSALALTVGLFGIAIAQDQPDPVTDLAVTGHVYEPQKLAVTDARIQALKLPPEFRIHRFAEGFDNPRILAVADDGTIYVTQRRPGNLIMVRDLDRDGVADVQRPVLWKPQLHGVAIRGNRIYLVDVQTIYAADLQPDGSLANLQTISQGLPDGGQHPNRTLAFDPQGNLYVSVGSTCNACIETNPEHATVLQVDVADGTRRVFASGLRNTIGFGWQPDSNTFYGLDQGVDWLGDDLQSEELNVLQDGKSYGWPYLYDDNRLHPSVEPRTGTQLDFARRSEVPVAGYTAHSAPMQLAFYDGTRFPIEFRNDAFVAMRGSWNRKPASGYEVVRLRMNAAGRFEGFEPFIVGFLQTQPNRAPPWEGAQPRPAEGYLGRPVGVAVAADGALLVGDDSNNMIYRVVYGETAARPAVQQLAMQTLQARDAQPIEVSSSAFAAGQMIPLRYSDYGQGLSPPLSWSGVPDGTRSIVVLVEDLDAASPLPFVHWALVNLPADLRALPEGANVPEDTRIIESVAAARLDAQQTRGGACGANSRSTPCYFGPRPPVGDPPHQYHFQVYALDTTLDLPHGFNRNALQRAMRGHVLAKGELIGRFAKAP